MTRRNRLLLAAIALLLLLFSDDRHSGKFSDGRFLIRTAVAIAETGEIGQARGPAPLVARKDGDAVSRYGLGMSLCHLPAALLAPHVDRAFGPGASQPLFLVAPLLLVLLSAAAAAHAARRLGASPTGEALAILFATLAGPLAAYSQLELSEPLQAAALAVAFAAALDASR
ncbi:MAG TPA: hypothetical protein VGR00_14945, partial [Thermoanaerobaculia bacterium]|nr:hypothetical protein [Thermoanaerobaculia bacterium]